VLVTIERNQISPSILLSTLSVAHRVESTNTTQKDTMHRYVDHMRNASPEAELSP
jgi:hypothetical protein